MSAHDRSTIISTNRSITIPTNSSMIRICILNALSCISPKLSCLIIGTVEFWVIILGFYYQSNHLRFLILDVVTGLVFDAFSYYRDLTHYIIRFRNNLRIPHSEVIDWSVYDNTNSYWKHYHIHSPQNDTFIPIKNILCAATCNAIYGQSLLNWFVKFKHIRSCMNMIPPTGFVNIPINMDLSHSPVTYGLGRDGNCIHLECNCHLILLYISRNNITDPHDILTFLMCKSPIPVQLHYKDLITHIFKQV
jgi:hypothetical protein